MAVGMAEVALRPYPVAHDLLQHLHLRESLPDLSTGLDTAPVRKSHIEDHHVRTVVADPPNRVLDCAGLADHFHVLLGVDQRTEAGADDLVVVDEQNSEGGHGPKGSS